MQFVRIEITYVLKETEVFIANLQQKLSQGSYMVPCLSKEKVEFHEYILHGHIVLSLKKLYSLIP